MEPLKAMYSREWVLGFGNQLAKVDSKINPLTFQKQVFASPWKQLELKERINRLSDVLVEYWQDPLVQIYPNLFKLIETLRKQGVSDFNFPYIFLNDVVTKKGLNDFETSMKVLEKLTVFSSAEFAIRFFYKQHFDKTLKQMYKWSKHKEPMVRRLASEGSRPMLPWGIGIPEIKKNPAIHMPIIETLWDDKDEIVRRSAANHLNDISKLNSDLVLEFCRNKFGKSKELDKNLKHALRTLLKKGNTEALSFFSYNTNWKPQKIKFELLNKIVKIGSPLEFKVSIKQTPKDETKVRIEYKIGFLLANGTFGYKVFQLGERSLLPNEEVIIYKKHSFIPITTRVYYPGTHTISILLNGNEIKLYKFELIRG
ncbi:DNA alkylation repair protein [Leptospira sp. 2 VSF19]|uniref:DNA alkylation repair protein n=1 Tax=Leptospira soteropolitanensis TaxID=2950025 RepID=A0AAW5VSI1_9LEPT|nr:DNA alkylation repair protein [Leptospira soteropolitanensis]MCW7494292.1 DNA alkylation repair protein [Leptospira soteropolitanensis]MCW7501999.1 DNA alkylation repair protein [Leptospira soteropolitanensis]MCW7524138.1 DNA alkylation repair protein [Leptospira soteropolitanensis]MCW7528003.1 DNA alkylation repair protein [Leptospira soteropolitanensis]MCW7531857.1 DNA alkylation repair protein [Leptospira soteropolitanensis]